MAEKANDSVKKEDLADATAKIAHKIAQKADRLKFVLLALVVLVVVSAAVFSWVRRSNARREAEAENRVYETTITLLSTPDADAIKIFDDLAKEYAGLPAGARALINKFSYAYNTGNYEVAEIAARDFVKSYPKHALLPRARLALGQTLVMRDKVPEALALFRELAAQPGTDFSDLVPEAKLALAMALEREAESVRDNPEQYRDRLEAARAEYNDIVLRSRMPAASQRGFWSPSVVMPATFSLVAIRDRLAGHEHLPPVGVQSQGQVVREPSGGNVRIVEIGPDDKPDFSAAADGSGMMLIQRTPIDPATGLPVMATPPPEGGEEELPAAPASPAPEAPDDAGNGDLPDNPPGEAGPGAE